MQTLPGLLACFVAAVVAITGALGAGLARGATLVRTYRIAPPGVDPNGPSGQPSISADGRYVAFASTSTNLGPEIGNNRISNVYVFDLKTGQATLVSRGLSAGGGNSASTNPSISANGQVVAFASTATNLVPGTPRHINEIFVRVGNGPIRLLSVGFGGVQPDAPSSQPMVSADGRYVAFSSTADDLIAGDDNNASDVFVVTVATGAIQRVSVTSTGLQAQSGSFNPSISADGHLISFTSVANNLVAKDSNHVPDVFVHNMLTGTTVRESVSSRGVAQNSSVPAPFVQVSDLSADGTYIVFDSNASNLVPGSSGGHTNVFGHSLLTGQTTLLSRNSVGQEADNDSFFPATSANGQITVFESFADNLASPWTPNENIFATDQAAGTALNVDVTPSGGPRGQELQAQLLQQAALSSDGQVVVFTSGADDLISGDYNGTDNLYIRVINPPSTSIVQAPPAATSDPRPVVQFAGSNALSTFGLCVLDGHRQMCPMGRSFRLPKLRRGPHVLVAYAGDPGTLFDPQGVEVRFVEG